MTSVLYKNVGIVSQDSIRRHDIFQSGNNFKVLDGLDTDGAKMEVHEANLYAIPAFIDIHTHGAAGFDFTLGTYDQSTGIFAKDAASFHEGLDQACSYYLEHGVGGVYLTTMAASIDELKKSFKYLNEYLESNDSYRDLILGINLEGTFIKDPHFAGAQSAAFFQPLSYDLYQELQEAARGLIKVINIPPEHGVDALSMIRRLREEGLVVAAGHSGAYGDLAEEAIDAGINLGVHYLNGPNRRSPKGLRKGGIEESLLIHDQVSLELILDGIHVDPRYVRDVISRKGTQRVIGITDSMFVAGSPQINSFSLLGLNGKVSKERTHLVVEGKADTLFGSILNMKKALENLIKWFSVEMAGVWHRRHEAMSIDEAILSACQIMSYNVSDLAGCALEKSLLVKITPEEMQIIGEVDSVLP